MNYFKIVINDGSVDDSKSVIFKGLEKYSHTSKQISDNEFVVGSIGTATGIEGYDCTVSDISEKVFENFIK